MTPETWAKIDKVEHAARVVLQWPARKCRCNGKCPHCAPLKVARQELAPLNLADMCQAIRRDESLRMSAMPSATSPVEAVATRRCACGGILAGAAGGGLWCCSCGQRS